MTLVCPLFDVNMTSLSLLDTWDECMVNRNHQLNSVLVLGEFLNFYVLWWFYRVRIPLMYLLLNCIFLSPSPWSNDSHFTHLFNFIVMSLGIIFPYSPSLLHFFFFALCILYFFFSLNCLDFGCLYWPRMQLSSFCF